MMKVVKRSFSLLEVLIAVALTVAILMTLMFFYRQMTQIGIEMDRTKVANFNMRYIESRLSAILPKAVAENNKKRDFVFFSIDDEGLTKPGSQSLIFTFDNQVSLDKAFSNHVLTRLYLDKNGNLMIAYWPSPKRWEQNVTPPMKKELLLQGVENVSFEFYIAPKQEKEPPSSEEGKKDEDGEDEKEDEKDEETDDKAKAEPEPQGGWRREAWLQDYKQLPVMIKIIVTMQGAAKPLSFIYPLANAKSHVVYE